MKKVIVIIIVIITILILTSCSKKSDDNGKIQLWYCDYVVNDYSVDIGYLVKGIEEFYQKKEIPI